MIKLADAAVSPEHMRLNIASIYRHTCSFFSPEVCRALALNREMGENLQAMNEPLPCAVPYIGFIAREPFVLLLPKNYIARNEPCRENLCCSLLLHAKCKI